MLIGMIVALSKRLSYHRDCPGIRLRSSIPVRYDQLSAAVDLRGVHTLASGMMFWYARCIHSRAT